MRRLILIVMCLLVFPAIAQDNEDVLVLQHFYTYHQATGNRFVEGQGTFPDVQTHDLELGGMPVWLVAAAPSGSTAAGDFMAFPPTWAVALDDGGLQGTFQDIDGSVIVSPVLESALPPGMPPVFVVNEFGAFPQQELPFALSPLTHAVYIANRTLYVSENNNVVLLDETGEQIASLPFNALPDARIVLNADQSQAAVYVGATNERYVHGILGDDLEGAALIIANVEDLSVPTIIDLPDDDVFEGLSPIWADVDSDGTEDLITTVSSPEGGSQIRVYHATDGSLLASGPAIGQSERWRHQLAWGAFGPNGENELVEVLTPHIGGIVGFYRYNGTDALEIVATLPGYTSHVIESRNLDMAVAGDFDGDGQPEIVLPNQNLTRIAGLAHTAEGEVQEVWTLPLDGTLITNLAAVTLPDGRIGLAAGVNLDGAGYLRVWLPV